MAYVIQKGENLTEIAKKLGTTVKDLQKTNNILDANRIYAGHTLMLPGEVPATDHPLSANSTNNSRTLTGQNVPPTANNPRPLVPATSNVPGKSTTPAPIPTGQTSNLNLAGTSSDTAVTPNTQDLFNQTLSAMLKAAQGAGNGDLMAKRNAIIQARFNAGRAATPEELRVLSPAAQDGLRNLDQSGLETQLSGINTAIQTRDAKSKAEQDARENVLNLLMKKQSIEADQKAAEAKANAPQEISAGASVYDPKTRKFIATAPSKAKSSSSSSGGGSSGVGVSSNGKFNTDLDAIIGNTLTTIPTKFGQQTFSEQIKKARNDADKIATVASVVLKGQSADMKKDFTNQAASIKNVDKALALLNQKVKTGAINDKTQYVYNVFGKDFDPKLAEINAYITAAVQPYRNSITGAAWGDQEDQEYQQLFGSTKFSPKELTDRLLRVKEIMKDKSLTSLNAFINPIDTYANPFSTPQTTQNTGTIRVKLKSTGQAGSIPANEFNPTLYDKI